MTRDTIYDAIVVGLGPGQRAAGGGCRRPRGPFIGGLMTLVVLRKCCTVGDEAAPCTLPASWEASLTQGRVPSSDH